MVDAKDPKGPSIPDEEAERLAALDRYGILDTAPEGTYQDLTRIAAELTDRPMAAINFIDEHRQWVKAEVGDRVRTIDRADSICTYVIDDPADVLVVEDTQQDERFRSNPVLKDPPAIRSYAGAPVETPDGHAIGTICVLDTRPRGFSDHERELLEALSRQVMVLLELRRVADAHRHAIDRLEHRAEELYAFAAAMGHDLRAPLVTAASFLDLTMEEGSVPEEHRQDLERAHGALHSAYEMVEGLERLVGLRGRTAKPDPCSLETVVDTALGNLRGALDAADARTAVNVEGTVHADEALLVELVQNLVANAIKFAGEEPPVIEITSSVEADGFELAVADEGLGLDTDGDVRIFELFHRGDARVGDGQGIGLAMCNRIAKLHGGELRVEAEPDEGATFRLTVPEQAARPGPDPASVEASLIGRS